MKKLKPTQSGLTLVELLVAMVILFGGVLYSMISFMQKTTTSSQTMTSETQIAIDVETAFEMLNRDIFNATLLKAEEGLDSSTGDDYRGIAAIRGDLPAFSSHIGSCRYEYATGTPAEEPYSILRYTTIDSKLLPEKTRFVFNETNISGPASDFIYTFVHPANTTFLFENGTKNADEVYVQDGDGKFFRRYEVDTVEYFTGNIPPGTNGFDPNTTFHYNKVKLKMPKTFTGNVVAEASHPMITNSVVFGAITKTVCVDSNGHLVYRRQYGDTNPLVLVNPDSSGYSFRQFSVKFGNLKSKIHDTDFFVFSEHNDFWRECTNVVNVSLELESKADTNKTIKFNRNFFINAQGSQRASVCASQP